jgi:hypothetical protein
MWQIHYDDTAEPLSPAGFTLLAWAAAETFRVLGDGRVDVDLHLLDEPHPAAARTARRDYILAIVSEAAARMTQGALAGQFLLKCRAKSGGPVLDVPPEHWGIDDPLARIAASAYDPQQPYINSAPATHWLFADTKTFSWWIDDLRIERGEKPIWQRAFSSDATIDFWPKPGFHFIPTPTGAVEVVQPEPNGRRRGAPLQYDWEAFHREVIRMAHTDPDGLPLEQKTLKDRMLAWCVAHWGKEPSDSLIRDKISAIYEILPAAR